MSKTSGLGDNFYVGGYNLSGDVASLSSIHGGNTPLPVTGIDKGAYERIGGKRDGGMTFTSYFNTAAGHAHPALSALPRTDVLMSYFRGTGIGNPAASMISKQIGYDGTRADDGGFTFAVEGQASGYGLEWGVQVTPGPRLDASATSAEDLDASLDLGVGSSFGFQAYLHVFSIGSGTATIKIQDSDDNDEDPYADLGTFVDVSARGWQRIAVAGDYERYIKAVTAGTFTNLSFAVVIVPNYSAVSF